MANENENNQIQKTNEQTGEQMSESAKANSEGQGHRQMHEDRANPDRDHVPGHKGYNQRDHQENVNPTRREP